VGEPLAHSPLTHLDALTQGLDPAHVARPPQFPELFPKFHDFHEEIGIHCALGPLPDGHAVARQQELRSLHRILQHARRFVHLDGFAEGLPPLGRTTPRIAIGVQRTAEIPLTRSDFFGPMAVAMMGGLVVATALTLIFLPALYALWFRVRRAPADAEPVAA
jgi:hypothetical protein